MRATPAAGGVLPGIALLAVCVLTAFVVTSSGAPRRGAAAPPPVDPSGEAMPVGDLPGWKQVFTDDFAVDVPLGSFPAAVSTKWDAYPDGWKDTSKNGTYSPSKVVSVRGGLMNMHLHTENGVHRVAAPVPRLPGAVGPAGGQLYGRYAVRYRADPVPGYKVAWLLWPDTDDWADGEINFPEGDLVDTATGFMHYRNSPRKQDQHPSGAAFGSWHTAVIEWTPERTTFLLDGAIVGSSTDASKIPATPMHWVLQTETVLKGPKPSDTAAGDVQVDWVAAYALAGVGN